MFINSRLYICEMVWNTKISMGSRANFLFGYYAVSMRVVSELSQF